MAKEQEKKKVKEKFYLPNLRDSLTKNGKSFSDFIDSSVFIDKSPSRRAWADGTSAYKGVTETTANKMRIRVDDVFAKWGIDSNGAACIEIISY